MNSSLDILLKSNDLDYLHSERKRKLELYYSLVGWLYPPIVANEIAILDKHIISLQEKQKELEQLTKNEVEK
jgi:hypothetical protein